MKRGERGGGGFGGSDGPDGGDVAAIGNGFSDVCKGGGSDGVIWCWRR